MRVLQFLLVLGFALLSQAKMSTEFVTNALEVYEIKDFIVSDLISTEVLDRAHKSLNRTLSFTFADPNANTTIKCAEGWAKDANGDNAPYEYLYCGSGPTDEFFIWKFKTYTNAGNFVLDLAHSFSDPAHYPPPYNYVEYFSTTTFALNCSTLRGTNKCVQPGPVNAQITRISN